MVEIILSLLLVAIGSPSAPFAGSDRRPRSNKNNFCYSYSREGSISIGIK